MTIKLITYPLQNNKLFHDQTVFLITVNSNVNKIEITSRFKIMVEEQKIFGGGSKESHSLSKKHSHLALINCHYISSNSGIKWLNRK